MFLIVKTGPETKMFENLSFKPLVKNPPTNAGNKRHGFNPWVGKILLEKEMATHSIILAWRIPWTEEPGQATVHGVTKSWA